MTHTITEFVTLVTETCCVCGVVFAMPEDLKQNCRKEGPNKSFYCPNGHAQYYQHTIRDQELMKLKQEKEQLQQSRISLLNQLQDKEVEISTLKKSAKRRNLRIKAGVCPCCNRTFKQLAEHMNAMHPDYARKKVEVKDIHKKINRKTI